MIVVLAEDIPPAVRGRMKLWFIEIKTNVYISGVKDAVAREVVDYLFANCNENSSLIIIESAKNAPYYKIHKKGLLLDYVKSITGLPLIFDRNSVG